jgi:hypothetical protein
MRERWPGSRWWWLMGMIAACNGGDEPTGSGTGGDEEMPDG